METKKVVNKQFLFAYLLACNLQIDSSSIDGNAEFVHYQYSCILPLQVSTQFLCPTKLLLTVCSVNFRYKYLSYSEISLILCVLYFLFLLFFNLEKHVN